MIKRIRSEQLQPGMFIHDLNCGWIDHPFVFNTRPPGSSDRIAHHELPAKWGIDPFKYL